MGQGVAHGVHVPFVAGHTGEIHRVLGGAEFGHVLLQLSLNIRGGEFEGQAVALGGVGGQHAHTTAVGDDEQVVALHGGLEGESQGEVEEVIEVAGLENTSLLEGRAVDFGRTSQGTGVRGGSRGAVGRHTRLEGDDGFLGLAGDFHEAAAVFEALDVEGDAGRGGVVIQPFDGVGKIHIGHVADGNEFVEADAAGVGGGVHGDQQGAALRDQSRLADQGQERRKGSVKLFGVGEVAHNVGAENAGVVAASDFYNLVFQLVLAGFGEAGGDHDEALDALLPAIFHGLGDQLGGHGHDRGIHAVGEVGNRREHFEAQNFVRFGVDRIDLALKTALDQIFHNGIADFSGRGGGADHCHIFWPIETI